MKKFFHLLFLLVLTVIIIGSFYVKIVFSPDISQILFCMLFGLENSDFAPVLEGIIKCFVPITILYFILYVLFYESKYSYRFRKIGTYFLLIVASLLSLYNFGILDYIYYSNKESSFIEDNYVYVDNFKFPDKKKNLIVISLESFESTLINRDSQGYKIIPDASNLLNEDDVINFNKSNKKGMKMIYGAHFTTASLVSNSSALPFNYSLGVNIDENNFFNNLNTLGDLLYSNGYKNEVITSATSSFGAVKEYFNNHGKYDIIDIDNYMNYGFDLSDDDLGPWGFNDYYLFNIAKKRLKELSTKNQPFNLNLIGIDTHFPGGFIGKYSTLKFSNSMDNSYATESKLVYDFVNWVRNQDFYNDTVIVILGDHLSMDYSYYKNVNYDERGLYFVIVNSSMEYNNKDRLFTSLDTYPTVLASLGVEYEGDKLGLGVNLFGNDNTLIEEYGNEFLNKEFKKKSLFYSNFK